MKRPLRRKNWAEVAPLIAEDARVVFSDGSMHDGKPAIRAAYERNFVAIRSEVFEIGAVHWLAEGHDHAAYMFEFSWTGVIDGKPASGAGRGMAVLAYRGGRWVLVAEQLGLKR